MAALSERAPPELEPGVTVDSLATAEECDRALDRLTMAITSIERQLATSPRTSSNQPAGWRANAEAALRIKKLLLPRLQQRRADLAKAERQARSAAAVEAAAKTRLTKDRALIQVLAETDPDALSRAGQILRARHPELYATAPAAKVL